VRFEAVLLLTGVYVSTGQRCASVWYIKWILLWCSVSIGC
jgi:hypothetical protein